MVGNLFSSSSQHTSHASNRANFLMVRSLIIDLICFHTLLDDDEVSPQVNSAIVTGLKDPIERYIHRLGGIKSGKVKFLRQLYGCRTSAG